MIRVTEILNLILMTADFKKWMSKRVEKKCCKINIELAKSFFFFFPVAYPKAKVVIS